jgi:hypothetical protein
MSVAMTDNLLESDRFYSSTKLTLYYLRLPMKRFFLFVTVLISIDASAQEDYTWWNEIHQWDGVTPWNNYMTVSPAYFGPNALPVPELRNGVPDSLFTFEAAAGGHWSRGDKTVDSRLRLLAPFCDGRVAVEAAVVPLEFYTMDTVTRDLRAARDRDGKGHAGGDIYFSTIVSLLKNHNRWPDLAFEAGLRTASGTRLGAARYTDAPGYYFDISAGKDISAGSKLTVRPSAMLGFYSFQTFDVQQLQNDCLLYGAGFDLKSQHYCWSVQLAGYSGYKKNGDQPLVCRMTMQSINKRVGWKLSAQLGWHDFEYRSLHAGLVWRWIRK